MRIIQHNTEEDIGEEPQAPLQRLASESYSGESEMSPWKQTSNFPNSEIQSSGSSQFPDTGGGSGDCNGK